MPKAPPDKFRRIERANCEGCMLKGNLEAGDYLEGQKCTPKEIASVVDFPTSEEIEAGQPLAGQVNRELKAHSQDVDICHTYAFLCRPSKEQLIKIKKSSFAKSAANPVNACHSRLLHDISESSLVLAGGELSNKSLGLRGTLTALRGGGQDLGEKKVFSTYSPEQISKMRRFTKVYQADLGKSSRYFFDTLNWHKPNCLIPKTAAEFDTWVDGILSNPSIRGLAFDIETDGIDCLTTKIRCIAFSPISSNDQSEISECLVPFLSVDRTTQFFQGKEKDHIVESVKALLVNSKVTKVGHNAGYFDTMVIEAQLGVTPTPMLDTILMHRLVASELPHSLGFIGSYYTDAPTWKNDRDLYLEDRADIVRDASDDRKLHDYCAVDTKVTALITQPLINQVKARDQASVLEIDHKIQVMCKEMHKLGMYLNVTNRDVHQQNLEAEKAASVIAIKLSSGLGDSLNPNSTKQINKLLYQDWNLEPEVFTDSGEPSSGIEAVRGLLRSERLEPFQRDTLNALRRYRKIEKQLSTYIRPSATWVQNDSLGRFHPDYNAHSTTSGRLSSSNPNAQNFPRRLRDLVSAAPGHILVAADADQLELRMVAALANCDQYLQTFRDKGDPHAVTATMLYNNAFTNGSERERKELRDFAKRFSYAVLYGASYGTVYEVITGTEGINGGLPYQGIKLNAVKKLRDNWLKANPNIERWWSDVQQEWRHIGYLRDPVLGRRRDFSDGENPNEIINFKAQAAGAGIIHLGTLELIKVYWNNYSGSGTGLINQCHDSLVLEVPDTEKEIKKAKDALTQSLNIDGSRWGLDVVFTAAPKADYLWSKV